MIGLDVLVNVANVVYLASYSVRDILWLRILTVVGSLLLLPYYYLQPEALWAPIVWNLIFTGINIFWITKLMLERRPVQFTDDETRIYQLALRSLNKHQALKLFRLGTWTSEPAGTVFLTQGHEINSLTLIVDGKISVEKDGNIVDTLREGRFLGASSFLRRGSGFTAPVTVRATELTRVITWSHAELEPILSKDTDLKVGLDASLGLELSNFLQTARAKLLDAIVV